MVATSLGIYLCHWIVHFKLIKMVSFVFCVFWHNKNTTDYNKPSYKSISQVRNDLWDRVQLVGSRKCFIIFRQEKTFIFFCLRMLCIFKQIKWEHGARILPTNEQLLRSRNSQKGNVCMPYTQDKYKNNIYQTSYAQGIKW